MSLLNKLFGRKPRGLVLGLGGGGGRGLAHLGVLEVLEEHHIKPSAIVGTSIGALFGAMYALHPDIKYVRSRVDDFQHSETFTKLALPILDESDAADATWLARLTSAARQTMLYTRAATDIAVADVNTLIEIINTLCEGASFDDLKIPLYATAVSYPSGDCRMFDKGNLIHSLAASMAIPGVFNPVEIEGVRYVDGGIASELPAKEARMVAQANDIVVAVNVGARPSPDIEPTSVIGIMDWSAQVKALYLRQYKKTFADIVIAPMGGFTQWHDFSHPDQEIARGRDATLEIIPDLLKLLK